MCLLWSLFNIPVDYLDSTGDTENNEYKYKGGANYSKKIQHYYLRILDQLARGLEWREEGVERRRRVVVGTGSTLEW